MKKPTVTCPIRIVLLIAASLAFIPLSMEAQRLPRRGAGPPAASRQMSRPSTRPAARPTTRPTTRPTQRPSTQPSARPATRPSTGTREVTRPSTGRPTINGGHQVSPDREVKVPSNTREALSDRQNAGNRVGNNNIDIGNRDVNINIDNSRDFNINSNRWAGYRPPPPRPPYRPYPRPPYRYGGYFYFSFHPYYYHPYRPYYWGPVWHPWGFFVATMATTAIIISVNNQRYHYDQGVYYAETDGGYTVVPAPEGATVKTLPEETEKVVVNETTNNYYYGGAFYEKSEEGYTVVPATAGTIVPHLPEGGEEVKLGEVTYVRFGETYYQPIQVDGKDMYEIVDVRDEVPAD